MTIKCVQTRGKFLQSLRHELHASEEHRQNTGRMGTLQVGRGVPHHPYAVVRGNSRAVEGQVDRIGRRLVAFGVLCTHRALYPPAPAEMGHLRAKIVADLVADDADIAARRTCPLQQHLCTGQRLQAVEMDAIERVVEHFLRLPRAIAEQGGKDVAQRAMRPGAHFVAGPRRHAEGCECVAIALDDRRPGVDQRIVPIEQDSARPLRPKRRQVIASPVSANRTYSSRRRRAVGPTLPSPTFSLSIFTTGVTNEVALVMKASLARLASAKLNGRSTNLSCRSLAIDFSVPRVMPARMPLSVWRVTSSPSCVTIQALVEAPSVTQPSASISHAS